MVPTSDGGGYWLVASDGGIFSFGDAVFYGSLGGSPLSSPVVDMAPAAGGAGYWMLEANGTVASFGDAPFFGDIAATVPGYSGSVVGIAASPG